MVLTSPGHLRAVAVPRVCRRNERSRCVHVEGHDYRGGEHGSGVGTRLVAGGHEVQVLAPTIAHASVLADELGAGPGGAVSSGGWRRTSVARSWFWRPRMTLPSRSPSAGGRTSRRRSWSTSPTLSTVPLSTASSPLPTPPAVVLLQEPCRGQNMHFIPLCGVDPSVVPLNRRCAWGPKSQGRQRPVPGWVPRRAQRPRAEFPLCVRRWGRVRLGMSSARSPGDWLESSAGRRTSGIVTVLSPLGPVGRGVGHDGSGDCGRDPASGTTCVWCS